MKSKIIDLTIIFVFLKNAFSRLRTPARVNTTMNSTLKSPLPESHLAASPRLSSINKCLNSPRKTRDLPVTRLSRRFEEE